MISTLFLLTINIHVDKTSLQLAFNFTQGKFNRYILYM